MIAPPEAAMAAGKWQELTRWERAELGRGLRRQGWTYGEIMDVLPIGKGRPGRLVQGNSPVGRADRGDQGEGYEPKRGAN